MLQFFILILCIILFIAGLSLALYNRKLFKTPFFLMSTSLVMIFYFIFNISTSEKMIVLSEKSLEQISQIDWCDKEYLLNNGFEEFQDEYCYYDAYTVAVKKAGQMPKNVSHYKNFKYEFSETRFGLLDIRRLWVKKPLVTRSYFIYIDGLEISMFEHEDEGTPYVFEKIIDKIFEKTVLVML